MSNIDETSTEEKALKDMVRQRLAEQLSVHTNSDAENDKADEEALK